MALQSLKLADYSDKELLGIVADCAGEDGWAHTEDIAKTLGIRNDRPHQSVGSRLAWLKRYGVVEGGSKRWRLLEIGTVFLNGSIPKVTEKALDGMEPGQLFTVTRLLSRKQRSADKPVGHMLRREWRHGTGA